MNANNDNNVARVRGDCG